MTLLASHIHMRAVQREIAAVMVEGSLFPIRWVMAGSAIGAKAGAMLIVLLVAGIAIFGRPLIHIVAVTFLACNVRMFPFQLKVQYVVVKIRGFPTVR